MDRRISFTKARKKRTGSTSPLTLPPATRSSRTWRRNSAARATTTEAQSRLKAPGITRRRGRTAQSVSAMENWAMGFRKGARNACIQNRTSTARTKIWKSASRTKAMAVVTTSGVLPQGLAQLDGTVPGGLHGVDEVLLDPRLLQLPDRRLG